MADALPIVLIISATYAVVSLKTRANRKLNKSVGVPVACERGKQTGLDVMLSGQKRFVMKKKLLNKFDCKLVPIQSESAAIFRRQQSRESALR